MSEEFVVQFRKRESYNSMKSLHSHSDCCELYYLSSGKRRYFIQDSVMTVNSGGFVFIKAGLFHKTSFHGPGQHSRYFALIPQSWLGDMLPFLPPFFLCEKTDGLEMDFARLLREEQGIDSFSHSRCIDLAREIVISAYRSYQESKSEEDSFVREISLFVKENISGDLSLEAISSRMGLSATYLSHLFHKKSGMRLSDFIRSLRISIAAEALAKGETVASAATLAGYSDAGYFKDVFRQVMKISPSAYRKSARHL